MPFSRSDWMLSWWDAFARGRDHLAVCTVWEDEDLVAALLLPRRSRFYESLADDHIPDFAPWGVTESRWRP